MSESVYRISVLASGISLESLDVTFTSPSQSNNLSDSMLPMTSILISDNDVTLNKSRQLKLSNCSFDGWNYIVSPTSDQLLDAKMPVCAKMIKRQEARKVTRGDKISTTKKKTTTKFFKFKTKKTITSRPRPDVTWPGNLNKVTLDPLLLLTADTVTVHKADKRRNSAFKKISQKLKKTFKLKK